MMVKGRAWFAEALSTYGLVFFGPLAVIVSVPMFGPGLTLEGILLISFAHGSIIGLMVYAFGHISGAHINPAVTIPMIIARKISIVDGAGYIAFQLIGAVLAAATLAMLVPDLGSVVNFGTQSGPSEHLDKNAMSGFVAEAIFTFFLVTVIFMTAVHKKAPAGMYGLVIGGMVFLLHLVGVPLTGASMNPARTFGPALVSGFWEFHWIYWAGPIIGGIIAGVIMNWLYVKKAEAEA
jgi:aquaporin-4